MIRRRGCRSDGGTLVAPLVGARELSSKTTARLAGFFSLATIVGGIIAQSTISDKLVIPDNGALTATNILAHPSLYQTGFAVYVVEMVCQVTMMVLFYFAPLLVLGDAHYPQSIFSEQQRQSIALPLFKINDHGAALAMVFFGVYALIKGYLTIRSTFLPRILGVLTAVGGAGWLAYLWQPLGYSLFPYIAGLAFIASVVNIGWLLIVGLNEVRWMEQARDAESSIWR